MYTGAVVDAFVEAVMFFLGITDSSQIYAHPFGGKEYFANKTEVLSCYNLFLDVIF
jgi:hypothetical protein